MHIHLVSYLQPPLSFITHPPSETMQAPQMIDDMELLYFGATAQHQQQLQRYLQPVPPLFVVVFYPPDNSYFLLGTDENFSGWQQYRNYVFSQLKNALELPHIIFRINDFEWQKVK